MDNKDKRDYVVFKAIQSRVDELLATKQYDARQIKIECVKQRISITEFAKLAGVTRVYLSEMIHGRKVATPKTLQKILFTIEILKAKQNEKV